MFDTLTEHESPPEAHIEGLEILSFENVCSSTSRSGLDHVSTSVRESEVIGLAGLDGSGQSVFLKIACNLLEPDSGTVVRFAHNLADNKLQQDRKEVDNC